MEFVNGTVNLSNGSMLDATTSIYMNTAHAKFYGKGENTSMIKSPVITGQGFTYDGNLVIECDNHVEKAHIGTTSMYKMAHTSLKWENPKS